MVKMTNAEVFEMQRQEQRTASGDDGDPLNPLDRAIVGGGGKHLVLPQPVDAHSLKRIGGLLLTLGADLVNLSNQHELKHRSKILEWRWIVDQANREIRRMRGRPRKPWESLEN
jgi:hypothetical protein